MSQNRKFCIACDEEILSDAKICKHCKTLQNDPRFISSEPRVPFDLMAESEYDRAAAKTVGTSQEFPPLFERAKPSKRQAKIPIAIAGALAIFAVFVISASQKTVAYKVGWDGNIGVTSLQVTSAGGAQQYCEGVVALHNFTGSDYRDYLQGCKDSIQQSLGTLQSLSDAGTDTSGSESGSSSWGSSVYPETDGASDSNSSATEPEPVQTAETEPEPTYWRPTAANIISCGNNIEDECSYNAGDSNTFGRKASGLIDQLVSEGICFRDDTEYMGVLSDIPDFTLEDACTPADDQYSGDWIVATTSDSGIVFRASASTNSGAGQVAVGDGWIVVSSAENSKIMKQISNILGGSYAVLRN